MELEHYYYIFLHLMHCQPSAMSPARAVITMKLFKERD